MYMTLTCKCGSEAHYIGLGFRCDSCKNWYSEHEVAGAQKKYNKYIDKYFKDLFKDTNPFIKPAKTLMHFIER